MKSVWLKRKREKALLRRHPWVFSGAIDKREQGIQNGDIVSVQDAGGNLLGYGYCNPASHITIRMLSFGEAKVTPDHLRGLIREAVKRRSGNPLLETTDAYRVIFSEGDGFPGLIVDTYDGHLVMQCLTLGIDRMKNDIMELLIDELRPKSIFEKSDHEGRRMEGLEPTQGQRYGVTHDETRIQENGLAYFVRIHTGQKTGFYLDQRDNRTLIGRIAGGRSVLNLFSYTGGFTVAAARGGARSVISVDSSADSLDLAERNMALNRIETPAEYIRNDVFQFLRENPLEDDLIILDPPALAKERGAVDNACRGYKDLNLQVASKCPRDTLLLSCSCSRFIDMDLFQMVVFSAFADAKRDASIIGKYHQPCDHPTSIFCRETEYLKSLLIHVR